MLHCTEICWFLVVLGPLFFVFQDGKTSLYCAAWKGHNDIVHLLIEAKADLNLQKKV